MLRRLYDWVMRLAGSPHAGWALFVVAFAESSFFPVPPDTMLAPMVLTRPANTWRYAAICAGGSIIGGVFGYAIGYSLEPVGHWLLAIAGHANGEAPLRAQFARWGVWVILLQGLLPVPYKLVTITTGLAHFPLWKFIAASCLTRSVRFFGVAALVRRFGPALLPVIERRLTLIAIIVVLLIVAVVVAVKLLH
jgi:membrane protein YqaA with SNARE-associated domain